MRRHQTQKVPVKDLPKKLLNQGIILFYLKYTSFYYNFFVSVYWET